MDKPRPERKGQQDESRVQREHAGNRRDVPRHRRSNPGDLKKRVRRRVRAFTLIELLITVAVLGLAGALVIPAMTSTGALRVQSAVRTMVADMTFAQGDAMAFQSRRAIWFGKVPLATSSGWEVVSGNGYVLTQVNGAELNLETDLIYDPGDPDRPLGRNFDDEMYGGATITAADFNGDVLLIFDELGGPIAELDGPDPGNGGTVQVDGIDSSYLVTVLPFTGRITVERIED